MEKSTNCLNCGREIYENFCPNCGQKTSTHRYSLKHFVEHDLIHGIWHVDKGFIFTIKQLFTNPGKSIREYLIGKRVDYFNSITLLIIILGIGHFIAEYSHVKIADLVSSTNTKKIMSEFEEFASKYPKLILLFQIPLFSLFSFLWFRKAKLNFTEHFILNTYMTIGMLIISTFFTIISIFYTNYEGLKILLYIIQILNIFYTIWIYYGFFKFDGYKTSGLIFRSILAIFSVQIVYGIIGIIFGKFLMH